jgi:hypothetical protein
MFVKTAETQVGNGVCCRRQRLTHAARRRRCVIRPTDFIAQQGIEKAHPIERNFINL